MIESHRDRLKPTTADQFYVCQDTIQESHPFMTKEPAAKMDAYHAHDAALILVGERHEKHDLVNLVRTLLLQRENYLQHSVTLNRISWSLAVAMCDVTDADTAQTVDIDELVTRVIARITTPVDNPDAGWIVGNADQTRWRRWDSTGIIWTESREDATRYARREDAEMVHAEDEDAYSVRRYRQD